MLFEAVKADGAQPSKGVKPTREPAVENQPSPSFHHRLPSTPSPLSTPLLHKALTKRLDPGKNLGPCAFLDEGRGCADRSSPFRRAARGGFNGGELSGLGGEAALMEQKLIRGRDRGLSMNFDDEEGMRRSIRRGSLSKGRESFSS